MTNLEKFRKVFGLPEGIEFVSSYPCDLFGCDKVKCSDCLFFEESIGFWDKEYCEVEN